jgi:hypothetical protein
MGLPIVGREYNLVSLAFYAGFLFWGNFLPLFSDGLSRN